MEFVSNTDKRADMLKKVKTRAPYIYKTKNGRFTASIRLNGKLCYIGRFTFFINACIAYNNVASKFSGLLPLQHSLSRISNLSRLVDGQKNVGDFENFLTTTEETLKDGHTD